MTPTSLLGRAGLLACALLAGACAHTDDAPQMRGGARIERTDKEFDIATGVTRIAIDNPWGEINVRSRDEREVGIHAVIQRLPPQFPEVEFRSQSRGRHAAHRGRRRRRRCKDRRRHGAGARGHRRLRSDRSRARARDARRRASPRRGARARSKRPRRPAKSTPRRSDAYNCTASPARSARSRSARAGRVRASSIPIRAASCCSCRRSATSRSRRDTGGKLSTGFGLSVHPLPDGVNEAHARYGAGTSLLRAHSTNGEIVLEQLVLLGDDKNLPEDDD